MQTSLGGGCDLGAGVGYMISLLLMRVSSGRNEKRGAGTRTEDKVRKRCSQVVKRQPTQNEPPSFSYSREAAHRIEA
jgi:hypothetical protein